MQCKILRVARLFILGIAIVEVQFEKSFKRTRDFADHGFIGHTIRLW